jgi:hypothetical protein
VWVALPAQAPYLPANPLQPDRLHAHMRSDLLAPLAYAAFGRILLLGPPPTHSLTHTFTHTLIHPPSQVLHSRCFFEPTLSQHLCVPGVDMANHAFAPSAAVRIQHNPGEGRIGGEWGSGGEGVGVRGTEGMQGPSAAVCIPYNSGEDAWQQQ